MFRTDNLMKTGERELDYLCRLDVTELPSSKPSKAASKLMVDFILRNKLSLNGQKGNKYVAFREHDQDVSFIGGFGSRHQIAHIIIDQDFNVKKHAEDLRIYLATLYDMLDFDVNLNEECVIFSLKDGYTKLEDVEYVEFVYNAYLATDKGYYPESKIIVRHYLDGVEHTPALSMIDREDIDMDLVITLNTSLTNFNEILPFFIEIHKESFGRKLGVDVSNFNDDTNLLIQMMLVT